MLPTIDIGSIGALVAIGGFIKTVISYIFKALTFVKDQVVVLATGSRIWATAFFLLITGSVIVAFNAIFSKVAGIMFDLFCTYYVQDFDFEWEFTVVNQAIPVRDILELGLDFVEATAAITIVQSNIAFFRRIVTNLQLMVASWKT